MTTSKHGEHGVMPLPSCSVSTAVRTSGPNVPGSPHSSLVPLLIIFFYLELSELSSFRVFADMLSTNGIFHFISCQFRIVIVVINNHVMIRFIRAIRWNFYFSSKEPFRSDKLAHLSFTRINYFFPVQTFALAVRNSYIHIVYM